MSGRGRRHLAGVGLAERCACERVCCRSWSRSRFAVSGSERARRRTRAAELVSRNDVACEPVLPESLRQSIASRGTRSSACGQSRVAEVSGNRLQRAACEPRALERRAICRSACRRRCEPRALEGQSGFADRLQKPACVRLQYRAERLADRLHKRRVIRMHSTQSPLGPLRAPIHFKRCSASASSRCPNPGHSSCQVTSSAFYGCCRTSISLDDLRARILARIASAMSMQATALLRTP